MCIRDRVQVETASGLTGFVQSRYLTDAGNVTMPAATPAPTATPTNAPAGDGMTALEGEVYACLLYTSRCV